MGRLEYSLTVRFICLLAMGALAGCAVPAQTVSTPLASIPSPAAPLPLIGSTPTTLSAEFGQPTLLRLDGTAQVWLYHSTSCGLNLILYPDASGTPRVTMVSATDGGAAPENCTSSLQQSHFDATLNPVATSAALQAPAIAALEHPASS